MRPFSGVVLAALALLGNLPLHAQTCPPGLQRIAPDARYVQIEPVAGERVATDLATGLMWKQCSEGRSGIGCAVGSATLTDWQQALAAAASARSAAFAGFDDWRLPNEFELASLIETGCHTPAVNGTVFPGTDSNHHWTSTMTVNSSAGFVRVVLLSTGFTISAQTINTFPTRLVRAGSALGSYDAATPAVPGAPTIGTATAADASASVTFSAPIYNGNSAITGYTAVSTPGLVSGTCSSSPCTVSGLTNGTSYTFTVFATNAVGNGPASAASNAVTPTAAQTIAFGSNPGPLVFGGVAGSVSATASSGLAVVFGTTTPAICSVDAGSGALTIVAVGDCIVTADQAGNAEFQPAPRVTQTVQIGRAAQAIAFTQPANRPFVANETFALSATGGASGNPVLFASTTPAVCSVSGSIVTVLAAGSCTLTANQAGDANYYPAIQVTLNVAIAQGTQSIAFAALADRVLGDAPFTVTATGGASGNPVVFTSQTTAICTVSGSNGEIVAAIAAGTCTIAANQDGNTNYSAAPEVTRSFVVAPATADITVSSNANPANAGQSLTFTATVTGQAPTGTVEFLSDTVAISGCSAQALAGSGPATATCTTDQLAAGTRSITARYSGDANNIAATSAALAQVINARPTIDAATNVSVLEDASTTIDIALADAETSAESLQLGVTSSGPSLISNAALAAGLGGSGATRTLTISPLADAFGVATLTLTATDGNAATTAHALSLTVIPVNDPPQATYGNDRTHPAATSGLQSVSAFATGISPGPNESLQTVSFETIVIGNGREIVSDVAIDPDGTLRYTLRAGIESGFADIDVTAVDDGGTDNGGIDRGTTHRLRILISGDDIIDLVVRLERIAPAGATLSGALAKGATMASYRVTVTNNGPIDAVAARVAMTRQIGLLDVLWSCIAPAPCTPPNGSGVVDTRFDLAAGQTLTLEMTGTVDVSQPFVDLRVEVYAPAGITAVFTEDDSDVLIERAGETGIFSDGFER